MRFNIPDVGFKMTLTSDWTFDLIREYRNTSLWDFLVNAVDEEAAVKAYDERMWEFNAKVEEAIEQGITVIQIEEVKMPFVSVTLPVGTELSVDRIYIRKGASDYSSVTFNVLSIPNVKKKGRVRFFASLDDVNNLEY